MITARSPEIVNPDPRMMRGYNIATNGSPLKQIEEGKYQVPSQSGNGNYIVSITRINEKFSPIWSCTCPDYLYRKLDCKHIHATRFWIALQERIRQDQKTMKENELPTEIEIKEVKPEVVPTTVVCRFCNSNEIVKNGSRKTHYGKKPKYLCKACGRNFVLVDEGFERMKFDPKIVTVALDLYFKSTSIRKIADHVSQFYGAKIHPTTVLYWADKYMEVINDYVATLEPQISDVWHTDEMEIKVGGKYAWL